MNIFFFIYPIDHPFFYGSLKKFIKQISPAYIMHTGDFVDDVNLEIRPYKLWIYEKKLSNSLTYLKSPVPKKYR